MRRGSGHRRPSGVTAQLRDRATLLFNRQQSGGGWTPLPRRISCTNSRGSRSSSCTSSEGAGDLAAARNSELLLAGLRRTAGQVRMIHRLSRHSPLRGRNLARVGPNVGTGAGAAAPKEPKVDEVGAADKGTSAPAAE